MVLYGNAEKELKINQIRKSKCPNCGESSISFHIFQGYFHLYWVPIFPIERRKVAACEKCEVVYENKKIPQSLQSDLAYLKSTIKTPPYLFSGLIIIALVISSLIYFYDGTTTYKYPSGKKQSKGLLIGDEMEGKWTFWYENGNVNSVQYFKNGKEDSTWTWWNEDGSILKTGNYKNGVSHGKWTFYYPSGQVEAEEIYLDNRLTGKTISWYKNGQKSSEGYFLRNLPDREWKFWYENGQLYEEGNYKSGQRLGNWLSYYENGSKMLLTQYVDTTGLIIDFWNKNGEQLVSNGNGDYTTYFDNGTKESEGAVRAGKMVGIWKFWNEIGKLTEVGKYTEKNYELLQFWNTDGKQQIKNGSGYLVTKLENGVIIAEGEYLKGLTNGEWKFRNESGILISKVMYTLGLAEGESSYYFETGELDSKGLFKNNLQHGIWTWYFENGSKQCEVEFINGKKEGVQTFWNEGNKLVKKEFYSKGELLSEEIVE